MSATRVLWVIKGLGLGGAERMLADALAGHDRRRFRFEVAYLLPHKGFLAGELRERGAGVSCLGARGPLSLPLAVRALRRLISECGIDVVHAHLPLAGVVARLAARGAGVPVIYTEHNLQQRYHPLTRLANRLTFGLNARVIAVSEEVARSLREHGLGGRAPVEVLPNRVPVDRVRAEGRLGPSVRRELGIPGDAVVVGAVSVLRIQKRLQDWLAVAREVCGRSEAAHFLLAGDGPQMGAVRDDIARLGLGRRVTLPGFRADGRAVLGALDVYLTTSAFEGLPIALLEAMALGTPVVATAAGGIPEAVADGREGFLAPIGAVDHLAGAVLRLLEDAGLRSRMGGAAAETARSRFDLARNIARIEELYAGAAPHGARA